MKIRIGQVGLIVGLATWTAQAAHFHVVIPPGGVNTNVYFNSATLGEPHTVSIVPAPCHRFDVGPTVVTPHPDMTVAPIGAPSECGGTYEMRLTSGTQAWVHITGHIEPSTACNCGTGSGGGGTPPPGGSFDVGVLSRLAWIYFTQPTNHVNLTCCAGTTNDIAVKVVLGNATAPTSGTITFGVTPLGLGSILPGSLALAGGGTAIAQFFAANTAGSGTIAANSTSVKDDHGSSVPDVSANISATNVKVIIEKCSQTFLPKGGTEANTTTIRAYAQPNTVKGKFRFTLFDVSNEPGNCMNAPSPIPASGVDSAGWKDLQFLDPQTGFTISGGNKDMAETTAVNLNEATVTVKCYDYGAYGKIKVEFIHDGTTPTCIALEDGGTKQYTRIPLDTDENKIADAAAQNSGPAGTTAVNDDNDPNPAGNGHTGELLTRYEEYRGFLVGGVHTRTDVTKKDVFLRDLTGHTTTDGNGNTLSLFSKLGCDTHLIAAGESSANRRINFNGGITAQRAIWVQASTGAHPNAGGTGGAWGLARGPFHPSAYTFCRVWVDKHKRSVRLFKGINDQPQDGVVYDTDPDYQMDWQPNGRSKIENEILGYGQGIAPGTIQTATTAQKPVPANSTAIIVSALVNGLRYVRIDNEVIYVFNASTLGSGLILHNNVTANANLIPINSEPPNPPGGGAYYFVKIGILSNEEWISYTGKQKIAGVWHLTGVARGVLGSTAKPHAKNTLGAIPAQYGDCSRGLFGTVPVAIAVGKILVPVGVLKNVVRAQAGTAAAAHAAGKGIAYFSNIDDALRQTAAHEAAHVCAVKHDPELDTDPPSHTIMEPNLIRGSYLGNRIWNDYSNKSKGEFDAR